MCKVLNISRSTYYSVLKRNNKPETESDLETKVMESFFASKKRYGARKIQIDLRNDKIYTSRRKIRNIMKKHQLESVYQKKLYKNHQTQVNETPIENVLNREFSDRNPMEVVVSDLTYVRVGQKWHYVCILIDLFNREIIGYSAGKRKDAELVKRAFMSCPYNLNNIQMFHTDRGSEFDNQLIDEVLLAFNINRSLSDKGTPYDNAVAESSFKSIKTEFIYEESFDTLRKLELLLTDYVHWWNNRRYHGGINYATPIKYRNDYYLNKQELVA